MILKYLYIVVKLRRGGPAGKKERKKKRKKKTVSGRSPGLYQDDRSYIGSYSKNPAASPRCLFWTEMRL
jgi:hypothetical protein